MSGCEKCWRDAHGDGELDVPERYRLLLVERTGEKSCTPEQQAGSNATKCPSCDRTTRHQITGECMACGERADGGK